MADMARRQSYRNSPSNCRPTALCLLWGIVATLASSSLAAAAPISSLATADKSANRVDMKDNVGEPGSSVPGTTHLDTLRQILPEGSLLDHRDSTYNSVHPGNALLGQQSRTTVEENVRSESKPRGNEQATTPSMSEHQARSTEPDKSSSTKQLGWETFFAFMTEQSEENSTAPATNSTDPSLKMPTRDYARNTVDPVQSLLSYDAPSTQREAEGFAKESITQSRVAAGQSQSDISGTNTGTGSEGPKEANLGNFLAGQEGRVRISDKADANGERGFRGETTDDNSSDPVERQAKREPQGDEQMSSSRSAILPVTSGLTSARNNDSDRGASWKEQADKSGDANLVNVSKDSASTPILENALLDALSDSVSAGATGGVTHATPLPTQSLQHAGLDGILVTDAETAKLPENATAGEKRANNLHEGAHTFDASTHVSDSSSANAEELRSPSGSTRGDTAAEPSSPLQASELRRQPREEDSTRFSHREKEQLESHGQEMEEHGVPHINSGTLAEQERFLRLLLSAVRTADNTYGVMPAIEDPLSASHVVPSPPNAKNKSNLHFITEGGSIPRDRTQAERGTAFASTTYQPEVHAIAGTAISSREFEKVQETRGATEDAAGTIWSYPQTSKKNAMSTEPESDSGKTKKNQVTDSASLPEKTREQLYTTDAEKVKASGKITKKPPIPDKTAESHHSSKLTVSRSTHQKKTRPHVRFQLQEGDADALVEEKGDTLRKSPSTAVAIQQLTGRPSASSGNVQQDQQVLVIGIQENLIDQSGSKVPPGGLKSVGRLTQVSLPNDVKLKDSALQAQEATLTQLLLERRRLLFAISELIGNVGAGLVPFTSFLDKEDPADQSVFFEISRTYPEVIRALLFFRHPSWPTATSIKRIHQEVEQCAGTAENLWRTVKALKVTIGDSTGKDDLCASLLVQKLDIAEKSARTAQLFARVFFSLYQLACYYVTEKKFKDAVKEATTMRQVFPEIHSHLMDALLPSAPNSEKFQHDTIVDKCPFQQHSDVSLVEKEITLQREVVGHLGLLAGQLEVASRFEAALLKLTALLDKRPRIVKPSPPDSTATKTRFRGRKRMALLRRGGST